MITNISIKYGVHKFAIDKHSNLLLLGLDTQFNIHSLDGNNIAESKVLDSEKISVFAIDSSPVYCWGHFAMDGKTILYSNVKNSYEILPDEHINIYDTNNDQYYTVSTKDYTLGKLDSNLSTKIWSSPHGANMLQHFQSFCFIRSNPRELVTLNNQTGEELWDYTLPETYSTSHPTDPDRPAKIQKILGIYNDVLWVVIDNGCAIGINIDSGEQVASIEQPDQFADGFSLDMSHYNKKQGYGCLGLNTNLDNKRGVLFNIDGSTYSEIDLNQSGFPYIMWDISGTLKAQPSASDIYPFSITGIVRSWSGDTISVFDKSDSRCFGQFDRVAKQIIWSHIFDDGAENCGGIHDLKAINNYIYVHARSDKSLYVYKLENEK